MAGATVSMGSYLFHAGYALVEDVLNSRLQDFVAAGANTGDCRADDDVGDNADALRGSHIRVENTESANERL